LKVKAAAVNRTFTDYKQKQRTESGTRTA